MAEPAAPGWVWEGNGRAITGSCKASLPLHSDKIDPWHY